MNRLLAWILFIQPQLGSSSAEVSSQDVKSHSSWQLLNYDRCGMAYSDRIIGGVNASIGAYPWIARVGYTKKESPDKTPTFRCGGSILNNRYVITAAHCVTHLSLNTIVSIIRLGEHNTETNPDCEKSLCNEPHQDLEPAEIIFHEDYDKPNLRNDIALIKTAEEIIFNDFIKPICLMKDKMLKKTFMGLTVEVAGWGIYDINEPGMSEILQTVKLPVVKHELCVQGYHRVAQLDPKKQLCVGGKVGKDSCGGDSGGPLMKVDVDDGELGPRYYLIGLVSFGPKLCGETKLPGIYTRISEYMPWILDHVKP